MCEKACLGDSSVYSRQYQVDSEDVVFLRKVGDGYLCREAAAHGAQLLLVQGLYGAKLLLNQVSPLFDRTAATTDHADFEAALRGLGSSLSLF